MVRRLQKEDDALDFACRHLEEYLETAVRARRPTVLRQKKLLKDELRPPSQPSLGMQIPWGRYKAGFCATLRTPRVEGIRRHSCAGGILHYRRAENQFLSTGMGGSQRREGSCSAAARWAMWSAK